MSQKRDDFIKDVEHQIRTLKANATPEELSRMNINTFDPRRITKCIYGQITGSCISNRAQQLMDKSCIRVMDVEAGEGVDNLYGQDIDSDKFNINGAYNGQTWLGNGNRWQYLSALEGYI